MTNEVRRGLGGLTMAALLALVGAVALAIKAANEPTDFGSSSTRADIAGAIGGICLLFALFVAVGSLWMIARSLLYPEEVEDSEES